MSGKGLRRILAYEKCIPSAKRLQQALLKHTDDRILVTSNARLTKNRTLLVRYGNSEDIPGLESGYNSQAFVRLSSNKKAFARLMAENNITSPVYFSNDRPDRFPVIIRTNMQGMGGRGIFVVENMQEFRDMWHFNYRWTYFYKTDFEIRVHVLLPRTGGVVVPRIFRKTGEDSEFPIRTNDGYHYQLKNVRRYKKAVAMVHEIAGLMKDAGGKFFALDMGYSPELKDYIIFESNSAPGINDNTAEIYAKFMLEEGLL